MRSAHTRHEAVVRLKLKKKKEEKRKQGDEVKVEANFLPTS